MKLTNRSLLCILSITSLAIASGCTSNSTTSKSGTNLTVAASDDACVLSATAAPVGKVTFAITNSGKQVNEFYVYDSAKKIVGEVEGIGPGLTKNFSFDATAGTYETACKPGEKEPGIRGSFSVTAP
jgi:iron uptake system component EfeO